MHIKLSRGRDGCQFHLVTPELVATTLQTCPSFLRSLCFVPPMGGGPRTFPGGLNKWQWKRLHEKRAREKEKKLLDQEKQLYEARVRTQIRAKLAGKSERFSPLHNGTSSSDHRPMSPKDHIKALADRFMKDGAEDLWNEADGPIKSPPRLVMDNHRFREVGSPINLRKLIPNSRNLVENRENIFSGNLYSSLKPRHYSSLSTNWFGKLVLQNGVIGNDNGLVILTNLSECAQPKYYSSQGKFRRNESSESEGDTDDDCDDASAKNVVRNSRWPRLSLCGEDTATSSDELVLVRNRNNVKKMMGSIASLGKYDVKTEKRVRHKYFDDEDGVSEQVEPIRLEFNRRNSAENEVGKDGQESILSGKRFDQCGISHYTVKALSEAGYVHMTKVQEATLSSCLEGKDAIVKAKTGTGKSAAFLLPAIEAVMKATTCNSIQHVSPIYVLVLCPTRELASQVAAEANVMAKYHDGLGVQTLVGGTRFKVDQKRLESDPCQIIVATPGRLLDHIENKSGFSVRLMGLKMLILDEADHLLDLGFRKDMEKIVDCLPRQRQSLLFSATIPREVRRISQLVLRREHVYIDTVGLGCVETHAKVKQSYLFAPHGQHFQTLHHLLKAHMAQVLDYKVIVFCTTATVTSLIYQLLREMKMNVREIHSRKTQLYRTRISDEFKESRRLILITSDILARGMNYPDVTLVIQVGIPSDREQYIHRLGRTGREGKGGEGILLLAPWEEYFMDQIKDLPLKELPLQHFDPETKLKLDESMAKIDSSVKEAAYHSWLGYYNSIREIGRDKTTLVELANQFSESIGLKTPPAIFRKTALKMGLKGIPGIRIRK